METAVKKEVKQYASRLKAIKRAEKYYPSETLKKQLNDYSMQTGVYKSELAVRLMKAFFAARRKQGKDPSVIEL